MTKSILTFCSLAFTFSCVPEQDIVAQNPFIIETGNKPWVIAHGGSKDLYPENTLVAFDGSYNIGVDAFEMDVNLTKDDILVCHHDAEIDRMSDGEGKVLDYTYNELLDFNFGHDFIDIDGNKPYENVKVEILKLEDLMLKYPNMPMVIEIKNSNDYGEKAADILIELIEKYGRKEITIIASFHDEIIEYILKKDEGIMVSTAQGEARKMVISTKTGFGVFYFPDACALQIPMESAGLNLAKKRVIKSAHRHNMAIHYWTIDDKEDMKLLIEHGADGLITDRPDLMHEVLEELGF